MALRGANGTCIPPTFVTPPPGEFWGQWPPAAAAIVANAGRRSGALPHPAPLPLSPPAVPLPNGGDVCVRLAVLPCNPANDAQRWFVSVDSQGAPVSEAHSPPGTFSPFLCVWKCFHSVSNALHSIPPFIAPFPLCSLHVPRCCARLHAPPVTSHGVW